MIHLNYVLNLKHTGFSSVLQVRSFHLYFQLSYQNMERDVNFLHENGAGFGAKIVRGAYMDQERQLAKLNKYEDPVNESFEATTHMYNKTIEFLLDRTKEIPEAMYFIIASHNEGTVEHAKEQ